MIEISSHVGYRFYQFATTRYSTKFYIIKFIFFLFFQGQEGLQGSDGEVGLPGEKVRCTELISIIVGDKNRIASYVWLIV